MEINTRLEPERNLWDWGLGDWVDENHIQDLHFYNTKRDLLGKLSGCLWVSHCQPALNSIIFSGIIRHHPATSSGEPKQRGRRKLLRQGLLHDGISLLLRHITMDGSHLGPSDFPPGHQVYTRDPPQICHTQLPGEGPPGPPGCEVGISHLLGQPIHL